MAASRRRAGASALLVPAWLVGAAAGWGGTSVAAWVSDVSLTLLALWAAVCLGRAARRREAGRRLPFALLSAACGLWALGEGLWSWYELVLGKEVPFPSVADLAYLGAAPVAGCGLLSLSRGLRQGSHRARAALDSWLVAGSCFAVGWVLLLEPVTRDASGGPLAVSVAIAYPVMDLMLATVALLAVRSSVPGRRRTLVVVAAAILSMAFADGAFTLLELTGRYSSGGPVDAGWVAAYLLFARAGRADATEVADLGTDAPVGKLAVLMPYLLVLGAVIVLAGAAAVSARPGPVGLVLLASLVLALVVRQALTVLDNASLASLLALRERHFRSLVHGAKDVIVLCGRDLHTTYVSPSSSIILGIAPEDLVGRAYWELVHPDDVATVRDEFVRVLAQGDSTEDGLLRCRIATSDGWIDTESTLGDLRGDPSVAGIVITTRDVTERTALEARLRAMAWQDPLTGLANRTLLHERVEHALAQRRPAGQPLGLLLIDLDGFKPVNDTHGHAVGDALLVQVAERLLLGVRVGDTVARLGGDEFAVLLEDRGEGGLRKGGLDVAERLLTSLSSPFLIDGKELTIGASMGLTIAMGSTSADDFVRQADYAMYASKDAGRGRVTVFGPALAAESTRRTEIAKSLGEALAAGRLHLEYQPVVDVVTGTVTGAEALARWNHPTWGAVSPAEFVAVAERTGHIVQLGHWALITAVREAARWEAAGQDLGVAVNVSVRQLGVEFVAEVASVLAQTGLSPAHLTLEITESVLVDDDRTLVSLEALKALGVRLAIDDFGTGWSSLAYLRRLPVDVLKLDGSFVAGLGSAQADAVSRTVVQLAIDLGLEVVAEGVETAAQRDILLGMGCHSAQGWLYGAAGPPEAIFRTLPSS
ncbi:MAG: EAL domain-containing protein, partial [Actinomycetota bacterium]|nr:EAL domain-containing protein [Actinomycetota bacterium]